MRATPSSSSTVSRPSLTAGGSSSSDAKKKKKRLAPLPPRAGTATVQGARPANEDRAHSVPAVGFYGMHDGHSGTAAAERLVRFFEEEVAWTAAPAARRDLLRFLIRTYERAAAALRDEPSGAASIVALRLPDGAVGFAWVGDCQGAIFDGRGVCAVDDAFDMEGAEAHLLGPSRAPARIPSFFRPALDPATGATRFAATAPHSLVAGSLAPPLLAADAKSPEEAQLTRLAAPPCWAPVERFETATVRCVNFQDAVAQREYDLARIAAADPLIDIELSVVTLGQSTLLMDMRFAGSVQPTRALGNMRLPALMRHPSALYIPSAAPRPDAQPRYVLLTSDGAFSGGAFADIHALAAFLSGPVAFVRARFYRPGQELSERLVATRQLILRADGRRAGGQLGFMWRSVTDWEGFLRFLDTHLAVVAGAPAIATLAPCPGGALHPYRAWLTAARSSAAWLKTHTVVEPRLTVDAATAAEAAAHVAVLMGAGDNVSVLVASI